MEDDEYQILVDLVIPVAQWRLDGRIRDADALDTKALGMLGVDAAAIALLIAAHDSIIDLWWIPATAFVVAGGLLIATIWPRRFDIGPKPADFYSQLGGEPPLEAARQMLSELLDSFEKNAKRSKVLCFRWAMAIIVISFLGCIPVTLIRPS